MPMSSYSTTTTQINAPTQMKYPPGVRYNMPFSVGWAILLYIVLFCLSFIVLFTFNPGFVQSSAPPGVEKAPNTGLCFITSLVTSLVICAIIFVFMKVC